MNFAALPPEINSIRMYSGPGSGPLLAAAAAWDGLAAELHSAATACQSVVSRLAGESWVGPSSQAMAAAFTPYVSWLAATAVQAEQTATQGKAAAAAYGAAFAMTVPPSVVAANRAQLLILVATNVLGQNTAAIAAAEAHYAEMWGQDAAAMYGYAISSAQAAELPPFAPPPRTTNPAASSQQAAAVGQDAGSSAGAGAQQTLSQLSSATANATPQAAPAAATPVPTQEVVVPDLVGLDAVASAGLAGTYAGVALSGGAWTSADESTRQILKEQGQLSVVQYDILHAIDLFSPLTPSRPEGMFVPSPLPSMSAATGEAVSVGKLSVPMSWAANAPEIRSLAYAAPTVGAGAASAASAASAATAGSAGTAFSQMALAGMGGSALAGTVKPGRQQTVETSTPQEQAKTPQEPPDKAVTGIAAEIREFAELRDRGLITDAEYNEQKQRLLGR
ncbi:MAG TPA: PPE domain-containing protein [Mycobacterium sp.]|nr:PPE domain-containing protein [Mycobacterium sp.]